MSAAGARLKRDRIPWRELPCLRVSEVCEVLGLGRPHIEKLIEDGELEVKRHGRIPLVLTRGVIAWIEGAPPSPQSAPISRKAQRDALRIVEELE